MKIILCILLMCGFVNAAVYKGQSAYKSKCRKCHGSGQKLAVKHSMRVWKKVFKNKGTILVKIHKNSERSLKYLNSKRFRYKSRHLKDFFVTFANDSGMNPVCE